MYVRVEEIVEQDQFETQHGTLLGWKFRATDEAGNQVMLGINTKPNNTLKVGQEFEFEPTIVDTGKKDDDGRPIMGCKTVGIWMLGKRAQNQGRGGNPYAERGSQHARQAPQAAPAARNQAPSQQGSGQKPIELEPREYAKARAQLISIAYEALLDSHTTEDAISADIGKLTEIAGYIGRDMADACGLVCIRKQTESDKAAKVKAAAEAAEAARKAAEDAQRAADEAASKSAGYQPAAAADDDSIPF